MRPVANYCVSLLVPLCLPSCQWSVVGGQFPTDDCKLKTENSCVLLDFYADWCGPCQAVKPVVDSLASEGYAVRRVNVNENKELAARYGVESIPCFIVVEQGREVSRVVGPTTIERLKLMYRRRSGVQVRLPPSALRLLPPLIPRGATSDRPATGPPWSASIVRTMRGHGRSARARWSSGAKEWWCSPPGTSSRTPRRSSSNFAPKRHTGPNFWRSIPCGIRRVGA